MANKLAVSDLEIRNEIKVGFVIAAATRPGRTVRASFTQHYKLWDKKTIYSQVISARNYAGLPGLLEVEFIE